MAHVHKIAISMSRDVLALLDKAVARSDLSRSRFIQLAVQHYLRQQEEERIRSAINTVFADEEALNEQAQDSRRFLEASSMAEEPW